MAYEPPITIFEDIANQITEMRENSIYMAVRQAVDVDKAELLKALAYDRQQYQKGFEDAKRQYERQQGHRMRLLRHGIYVCDQCGRLLYVDGAKYCWCCGTEFVEPNSVDADEV